MRTNILKIVVVLLLSGSGEARPRKIEESRLFEPSRTNAEEWRPSSVPRAVREDSRYTWNSGSTSIPYTNYYRGNIVPLVEHVDRPGISKSTKVERPNTLNRFLNYSRPIVQSKRSENLITDTLANSDSQTMHNTQEQAPIKIDNLTRRENARRRYFIRDSIPGDLKKDTTNASAEKVNQKFDSGYTRVPLLDSRLSLLRRTTKRNSTKNYLSKSPANVHEPFRISNRILLNNSLSNRVALNQNSEFSNQAEGFSPPIDVVSTKVESTTPFDHVKAIKKITSMLTQKQFPSESPLESKNQNDLRVPSILPFPAQFNRRPPAKPHNGTKLRRPITQQSNSNKKNPNKVQPNKVIHIKNNSTDPNMSLKNWPNGAIQNADDFNNYDAYTSMEDDTKQEVTLQKPFPIKNSSITYHVPMSSSNIQEIINWLKIPAFMTNGSHFVHSEQVDGPINVAFDPIYQNLESNKPAKLGNVQNVKPGFVYPHQSSGYGTEKIPNWLLNNSLKNKTQYPQIYNPHTQVSQNTVVHLINTDSRKPNRTIVGSKVPVSPVTSAVFNPSVASSGPSSSLQTSGAGLYSPSLILSQLYPTSTSTSKPGPNVHIGFTSYEENNKVPDERVPQAPLVTYDKSCPTIVINTYTRINNTIQSKEGCTDLNIIINSHLFNTNVYKTTSSPLVDQSNQESYQTYGEIDKYGTAVDSGSNYQFVPTYQPSHSDFSSWPQNGYYDSQKHPQSQTHQQDDVSNIQVIHDTQISISNSAPGEEISPGEVSPVEAEETESLGDDGGFSTVADTESDIVDDSSLVRPAAGQAVSDSASSGDSPSPQAALATSSPSNRPSVDDDDDDYDLSPSGIMESIAIQSNETVRDLKDLQYMDQSVRTVATQLLNVSNAEEPPKILDNVINKPSVNQKPVGANQIKEVTATNGQAVGVGFRPIGSMFNYFESSHPGHAMAITEEELEKEMSSTRLMSAHKVHPTTTGGISTWILLNPPSTTMKPLETEKKTKQPVENEVKVITKPTTLFERVDTTERVMEKATMPVTTNIIVEEPSTTKNSTTVATKKTTASKPDKVQGSEMVESVQNSTSKISQTAANSTESNEAVPMTTKKVHIVRTTPKPKIANTKTTVLSKNSSSKPSRPNQPNRSKVSIRRTTVKPDIAKNETISTAKIEKVTFRPVQMITIPKGKVETTVKPMFVTKIKASILMDTQKATTPSPTTSTTSLAPLTTTSKTITPAKVSADISVKPKPTGTKVNNVLKVQLKKPLEDSTKIEIEPIKVNAPVLKIEKVEKEVAKEKEKVEKESENLSNTRIDLMQFDFNPELTKINVNTEAKEVSSSSTTESTTTSTTSSSSTTKRPRSNSKRKKNKGRRRKPSTSTSTTTTTVTSIMPSSTESEITADEVGENGIQESKIVPESKVGNNLTKTKKKPGATPISMQIYNFLSREVMPSFGVMSLVGLGLGLASYFLYPFGGTVTRRNYELEPKYKYNFDEYGGNYGQREEEVLSKVLQGMTTDETKYPASKVYDNNYYHYQHYDGGYEPQTTKKDDLRNPSSSPIYRPETSNSVLKFKNTANRFPSDIPSTTKYYDRSKPSEYVVGQTVPGSANRQFVVGSVPKGYPPYEKENPALSTPMKLVNSYEPTESAQLQFDHNVNQNFNFPVGSVQSYGQVQTARPEESYDEVEITPTAVAVEHGPRALKIKRSSLDLSGVSLMKTHHSRKKRDSVIQVIPSKRELEEEEKEEDLSNEILNIIDSALPGEEGYDNTKKQKKKSDEADKFDSQRRKDKEEEQKVRVKEFTTENISLETNTIVNSFDTSSTVVSSTTAKVVESSTSPSSSSTSSISSSEPDSEEVTTSSSKTTEESTVDWADTTTKKPGEQNGFNLFNFVKKIAEIKFRLGLTLLKHASEGFARYLGNVQKRINGEE